jgi:2-dehydro-3-deoxyglucarate aldolase
MEHGSMSLHQLPDIFRALELGKTLPLVRISEGKPKDCKQALDAGAGGVIVPMIESSSQLERVRENCCWPPTGKRGVAFHRANLFGGRFKDYEKEAQSPLLIAMIETIKGIENIDEILDVKGLDAIIVGPYDLSASLGKTAQFQSKEFLNALEKVSKSAKLKNIPLGIHVVEPSSQELLTRIEEGYQFIAFSLDSVMLRFQADYKRNINKD